MSSQAVEEALYWARNRPSWRLRRVVRKAKIQGSYLPRHQRARVVAARIELGDRESRR